MKWNEFVEIVKGTVREARGDVVEIRSGDDLVFSNDFAFFGLSRRMIRQFAKRLEGQRLAFSHGTIISVEQGDSWRGLEDVAENDVVVELAFSSESSSKLFFVTAVLAKEGQKRLPALVEGMEVERVSGIVYGNPREDFEIRSAEILVHTNGRR